MTAGDETTTSGGTCPICGHSSPGRGLACPDCTETSAGAALPSGAPDFTGPRRIAGYRVIREIGAGGMGTVFEAYQEEMHRQVALKVLSRHHAPSERADRRFEREAWIGGKLDHPNLVKVFERGEWEELSFYSMELVAGGSLQNVIGNMRRWGRDDGLGLEFGSRAYVEWAIRRVIEAARGLEFAHRRGVVHRDVKPMNLLLDRELGIVKIADFGLALDAEATRMTTAGAVLGTLVYMAPEQILGRNREIGPRTDVYALGVTLFELLTLSPPYAGETQQLYMNAVLTSEARRPSKLNERVSRDLEVVIGKTLEKDPRDRYASMRAFADDLENVLQFRPVRARPHRWPARTAKWVRRKPMHAALAATLLVAVPALAFLAHRTVEHRRLLRGSAVEEIRREMRLADRGDHRLLLDDAERILRIDPDNLFALRERALNALYLAQQIEERAPADPAVSVARQAALESMARMVRLEPENASVHRLHAFVLEQVGRPAEAERASRQAERHRSGEPGDEELNLDAMLAAGRGDHARAVELYSELIGRKPAASEAILGRAASRRRLGDLEGAERDYARAAAIDPEDAVARLNLGLLLIRGGEMEEGRGHVEAAARILPDNAIVLQALADGLLVVGRRALYEGRKERALESFRGAESAARRSLRLDPGKPWTRVNLGASLAEQHRLAEEPDPRLLAEAREQFEGEISLWRDLRARPGTLADPDAYAGAVINLCDACLQTRDLPRALEVCAEAALRKPQDPVVFYNLAGARALSGRPDDALEALERDLSLGDTDHEYLARDPWFASLRGDPRFADLLARMRRAAGGRP